MSNVTKKSIKTGMSKILGFVIAFAIGSVVVLGIMIKLGFIDDLSLGYIFMPGYILMLILTVMMYMVIKCADIGDKND